MRKRDINMVEGALLPNIIRFAIPMIFTNVLQLAFNAVDLVVVGNFGLPNSVGAIGATGSITQLIVLFFSGLSVGVGVTIAQAIGAKDDQMVHRAVHTALPTAIPCGLFCTIIGLLFAEPLLTWLGTPADVLPYSVRYMRIIFCGVPFLLIYNFLAAVLNAAGDAKGPFVYLTTAGVVHLILNLFFGIVLKMDVTGAALATILSQALSAILVTIALMRRTDACRLVLSKMRIYAAPFKKILLFGVPTGLQNALFCISTTLIQSSVNSFGSAVMSGNSAAQSLDTFISTAINGFKFAAINFVSQNMGARQYGRVKKILGICIACGAVVGGLLGLLVWGLWTATAVYLHSQCVKGGYQRGHAPLNLYGAVLFLVSAVGRPDRRVARHGCLHHLHAYLGTRHLRVSRVVDLHRVCTVPQLGDLVRFLPDFMGADRYQPVDCHRRYL